MNKRIKFNNKQKFIFQFHAFVSQNSPLFCSVSIAKRWIFVICEWICEKLEIEMVPGKHCPPDGSDFTSKLRELAIGPCKSKATGINSMTNASFYLLDMNFLIHDLFIWIYLICYILFTGVKQSQRKSNRPKLRR